MEIPTASATSDHAWSRSSSGATSTGRLPHVSGCRTRHRSGNGPSSRFEESGAGSTRGASSSSGVIIRAIATSRTTRLQMWRPDSVAEHREAGQTPGAVQCGRTPPDPEAPTTQGKISWLRRRFSQPGGPLLGRHHCSAIAGPRTGTAARTAALRVGEIPDEGLGHLDVHDVETRHSSAPRVRGASRHRHNPSALTVSTEFRDHDRIEAMRGRQRPRC